MEKVRDYRLTSDKQCNFKIRWLGRAHLGSLLGWDIEVE